MEKGWSSKHDECETSQSAPLAKKVKLNSKIKKLILSIDLLSNILPYFGNASECCILMLRCCKRTYESLQSYKQALIQDIFKDCKKEDMPLTLTEEKIAKLTQGEDTTIVDNSYCIYEFIITCQDEESYKLCLKLLEIIHEKNLPLKNSIDTIDIMNLHQNVGLYQRLFEKVKELNMPMDVLRTYITEITPEIPYLSSCYLVQSTPFQTPSIVEVLALDNSTDFASKNIGCRYLNQCKISCETLRIQDEYLIEMYDRRKDYSEVLRKSTKALRILVSDKTSFHELADSFTWTVNEQFRSLKSICFQYEEGLFKDFKIIKHILSSKMKPQEIFLTEEDRLNGDYLQAHYTDVYFRESGQWVKIYAKTLKLSYNCQTDLYDLTDDFIVLNSITEIQIEDLIKITPVEEIKGTPLVKYEDVEKDLILLPKNKVFVNRNELLNLEFLPKFDFKTINLFYTQNISYESVDQIVKNKSQNQMMDIDLEFSEYKVTPEFLDLCFKNQTRYLTFRNEYLSEAVFAHLLNWLKEDELLDYLEMHKLNETRLGRLLEVLKTRPYMTKLVLFFSPENTEGDYEEVKRLIQIYKDTRPFVFVTTYFG